MIPLLLKLLQHQKDQVSILKHVASEQQLLGSDHMPKEIVYLYISNYKVF